MHCLLANTALRNKVHSSKHEIPLPFVQLHLESRVVVVVLSPSCVQLFCDAMYYSLPGSSVHGIFQARILDCIATAFSRGSSQPRDRTWVSCIGRWFLYHWPIWEAQIIAISNRTPLFWKAALLCPFSGKLLLLCWVVSYLALPDSAQASPLSSLSSFLLRCYLSHPMIITSYPHVSLSRLSNWAATHWHAGLHYQYKISISL